MAVNSQDIFVIPVCCNVIFQKDVLFLIHIGPGVFSLLNHHRRSILPVFPMRSPLQGLHMFWEIYGSF